MSERGKLLLDELERSELTRDEPMPAGIGQRKNKAAVYSVRLDPATIEDIEETTKAFGVPPSALVRGFILEGLSQQRRETIQSVLDRVMTDVRKLNALVS